VGWRRSKDGAGAGGDDPNGATLVEGCTHARQRASSSGGGDGGGGGDDDDGAKATCAPDTGKQVLIMLQFFVEQKIQ